MIRSRRLLVTCVLLVLLGHVLGQSKEDVKRKLGTQSNKATKLLKKTKLDKDEDDRYAAAGLQTTAATPADVTTAPVPDDFDDTSIDQDDDDDELVQHPGYRLKKDLLRHYRKDIHPVKVWTDTVKVDIGMALIHLDLDERHSALDIDAWMRFNWTDQYLTWDPSQYEGIDVIHFGGGEIWQPDIHLYNNADGANMNHFGDVYLLVYSTGNVLWVPPAKFKAFCKVDLRMWPHENPTCKIKFGSWTSHGDQISLGLFGGQETVERLNFYTDNKEWILVNTTVK